MHCWLHPGQARHGDRNGRDRQETASWVAAIRPWEAFNPKSGYFCLHQSGSLSKESAKGFSEVCVKRRKAPKASRGHEARHSSMFEPALPLPEVFLLAPPLCTRARVPVCSGFFLTAKGGLPSVTLTRRRHVGETFQLIGLQGDSVVQCQHIGKLKAHWE